MSASAAGPRGVRGVTLVEMMVAMAVFSIAAGGIFALLSTQAQSSRLTDNFFQVQQNARYVLERIVEEARWADYIRVTGSSVEIHVPAGNAVSASDYCVTYAQSGATVTRAAGPPAGAAPAASEVGADITAFGPTWNGGELALTITATAGAQTRTFTTTVFPRNTLQATNPCSW